MPDIIDLDQRKKEISNKQNRERISRDIKYSEMLDKIKLILDQCIDGIITIGEFKGIVENIYNTLPTPKGSHEEEFKEGSMYITVPQRQKLLDKYARALTALTKLANDLDAKGLFDEANEIDKVAQEVAMLTEPGKTTYNFPPEQVESTPVSRKGTALINQIRQELGLPPGIFDRDMGLRLRKYPGVWNPGNKGQKASEILALLRKAKEAERVKQEQERAVQQITQDIYNDPRKQPYDITQSPLYQARFPTK